MGLWAIVYRTNPDSAPLLIQGLFFVSLALVIWGLATLIGYFSRRIFARNFNSVQTLYRAFRQGFIISLSVIILIFIQKIL